MCSRPVLSRIMIFLPPVPMIPSDERLESVRIAFEVVIFERLAISSLERETWSVLPSASKPYVSRRTSNDSARRPLICFWVSDTVLLLQKHKFFSCIILIKLQRQVRIFLQYPTKRFFFQMQIAESSMALAENDHVFSSKYCPVTNKSILSYHFNYLFPSAYSLFEDS